MMVVMDRGLALAQPCEVFRTEWRGRDGGCMRGETVWHTVTSMDQHRDGALSDRPRRSPSVRPSVATGFRSVLADCGANGHGDPAPGVAPRGAMRKMQDESTDGPIHPDRQFQQPLPQGGPCALAQSVP
jgi:hypothetical protein